MVANLLKNWDDAIEPSLKDWPKAEKTQGHVSIIYFKNRKAAADIWDASGIPKLPEIVYNHNIQDLEKRIKRLESKIFEKPDQIILKDISYEQAKKEIKEYFSKHHGKIIDAADIQEALKIDISLALEILDDLEREGKIKEG